MLSQHDLTGLSDKEKTKALSEYFQQAHIIDEENALENIQRLNDQSLIMYASHDPSKKDHQLTIINQRLFGVVRFVHQELITREIFCKAFEENQFTLLTCASTEFICAYITFKHELFALDNHTGCMLFGDELTARNNNRHLPKLTSNRHARFQWVIAILLLEYRTDIDMLTLVKHLTTYGFDFNRIVSCMIPDQPLIHQYLTHVGRSIPVVTTAASSYADPIYTDTWEIISPNIRMMQFLIREGGLNLELKNDPSSIGGDKSITILELCLDNLLKPAYDCKQVIDMIIFLLNNGAAIRNVSLDCLQNARKTLRHLTRTRIEDSKVYFILAVVIEQLLRLQGSTEIQAFAATRDLYLSGTTGQPSACLKLADAHYQKKQYEAAYQWYETAAFYSKKRLHELVGIELAIELFFFRHEKDMPFDFIAIAEQHTSLMPNIRIQLAQLIFRRHKDTKDLQRALRHNYVAFREAADIASQQTAAGNAYDLWVSYEKTEHEKFNFLKDLTSDSSALFDDKSAALPMRDQHEIFKFYESSFIQRVLQMFEAHYDHLTMLHSHNRETTDQHKAALECCSIVSMIPCLVDYATCVIAASKKDNATTNMMLTAEAAKKFISFLTTHRVKLQIPDDLLAAMASQPIPVDSKKSSGITQFALWEEYKSPSANAHATCDQIEFSRLIAKLPSGNPIQRQYHDMILTRSLKDSYDTLIRIISGELREIGEWKDEKQRQHLAGIYRECLTLLKGNKPFVASSPSYTR